MLALGLGLGIALFFLAPLFLASLADRWIESDFASNAAEGLIRIAVVVGYLAAIGLLPDIYRTLQYHGAEHKTVNAIEARLPLTVENVQAQSLLHPRCGTSFLLLVVVISIIGFALLGRPEIWVRLWDRESYLSRSLPGLPSRSSPCWQSIGTVSGPRSLSHPGFGYRA